MLLVHQPQSHFSTFPSVPVHHHRRHPSAPAPALVAAVRPTNTPGLLSLSKPQPAQRRSSPKLKNKSPVLGHATPARQPASDIAEKQPAKPSQSPEKRGRQGAAGPKPKSDPRSVSNRRQTPRQPSPPIPSSQAEPLTTSTTNKPFFDAFSEPKHGGRSTPRLAKPSGKLVNRRGQSVDLTPPKAIAIPAQNKTQAFPKRSSAPAGFTFPICDDISEAGDDETDVSPPTTPTRPRRSAHQFFNEGPKTAPLTSSASMPNFPFTTPSAPSSIRVKKAGRPRHIRSPSDGVFNMSDEDFFSSNGSSSSSSEELNTLFAGLLGKKQREMFASSTFLNSPDPDVLPPPSF